MKKIYLFITLAFFTLFTIYAQDIPDKPEPAHLVNDFAGIIGREGVIKLESALAQFASQTSTQIVVVTVSDLGGTSPSDFAFQLGEKWGVGQKDKNNGIVVLVKPKIGNSRGHAFVATGYGLEGILPDAIANQIVDNEMIPYFKKNDYLSGIAVGVSRIMEITRGEYTADQYVAKHNKKGSLLNLIIFVLVFILVLKYLFGNSRTVRRNSIGRDLPFWMMMGMMAGNSSRGSGSWGNFSSGSGGFSGGGFGGGGFGGGGAGGSW